MCHAVGQRMTGVRPGSFSNEHRMKCHTHAIGDRDGDEQPRGVHAPALGSGACSSPVVFLLPRLLSAFSFSRNADFMGVSGRESIKFPVLYRDSKAKNARDANGGCTFAKLESRKRASTCSHSTPKRTRGFIRYGGCKATTTQPKSAFCQNEANG